MARLQAKNGNVPAVTPRPPPNDDRIVELDAEIVVLKREKLNLENEIKRLKSVIQTYTSRVLTEHNYNL